MMCVSVQEFVDQDCNDAVKRMIASSRDQSAQQELVENEVRRLAFRPTPLGKRNVLFQANECE
ncbi:hypothetical protein A2U01_0027109 [Trifolium medium]|uniref:Uncharacterized protein n=1 Tax=Trifolium medium TaxID=97028 RepID=A0A392P2U3_9FABA|nr:hypothetical protein [Trifolium medium]